MGEKDSFRSGTTWFLTTHLVRKLLYSTLVSLSPNSLSVNFQLWPLIGSSDSIYPFLAD